MAKVEFIEGVCCKQCGKILQSSDGPRMDIYMPELCQNCGAHLININIKDKAYSITENGQAVIIKSTRKLFFRELEVVREV